MSYFFQGLGMGLAYVAPIGMQNLFVINQALTRNGKKAIFAGLMVTFYDISLAFACFFGVGVILERWEFLTQAMLLGGGGMLLYLGVGLMKSQGTRVFEEKEYSLKTIFFMAFVVTWLNPQAIMDGTLLLGGFRASMPYEAGVGFVLGVAGASCVWFNGLSIGCLCLGHRVGSRLMQWGNRLCGLILLIYGGKMLWQFFYGI